MQAEQDLQEARAGGHPGAVALALFVRGALHALQGSPAAALACYNAVAPLVPDDPQLQLRALAYAGQATTLQYNTFPDGGGGAGLELASRWDGLASTTEQEAQESRLLQQVPGGPAPALLIELRLLGNVLGAARLSRSGRGSPALSAGLRQQLLTTQLEGFRRWREAAAALGAGGRLLAFADRLAAEMCRNGGQPEEARQHLARAESVSAGAGDEAGVGACRLVAGDWLAAPLTSPLVWNCALAEGQASWQTEALELDRRGEDAALAGALYAEADRLFSAAGAPRGVAAVALRRGYLAVLAGDFQAAVDHAAAARQAFAAAGDTLGAQVAGAHHALALVGTGRRPESREAAMAIGAWGREGGSFSVALGLGLLCSRVGQRWLARWGDVERALASHRLAEALFEALGATANVAFSLADQGNVLRDVGDKAGAVSRYEGALDLFGAMGAMMESAAPSPSPPGPALAQAAVACGASLCQLYNDVMDAGGLERTAARLERQLQGLAPGAAPDGTPSGSRLDLLDAAAGVAVAQTVRSIVVNAHVAAPCYRAREAAAAGDDASAGRLFQQALHVARESGGAEAHFLESTVLAHQRRYPEAAAAYRRHLEQEEARRAPDLGGWVGRALSTLLGSSPAGAAEAARARERRHEQAALLFLRLKDFPAAQRHLQALEGLAGAEWWRRGQRPWEDLSTYGEVEEGLGHPAQALAYYQQAIQHLEGRRERLSLDDLKTALAGGRGARYLYFLAARAALSLRAEAQAAGDGAGAAAFGAQAFALAERGRARALLDLMAASAARAGATSGEAHEGESRRAWRQLTAQLGAWRGLLAAERGAERPDAGRIERLSHQIETDEARLRQVETALAGTDPSFYETINPGAPVVTVPDVAAALAPGTALLAYALLGEDLLAWAITPQGLAQTHHAALDVPRLEHQIRALHRACERRTDPGTLADDLAETFLNPLARTIGASTRLLIVPYGAAHRLPFHALTWEGRPLVESHTISYLPSASALQFRRPAGPGPVGSVLAVGDPARMAAQPLAGGPPVPQPPLPAAAAEARSVAALVPGSVALTGEDATEGAVRQRLSAFPVLHFATHGALFEEAPFLSSILLAEGEALTVYELMGLRLEADLVVLSACSSGRGATTGGDDVLGLTRGLLGAGARAAVVSLWPVDDLSTCLLMRAFYRRLGAGADPALALQAAQQYLRTLSAAEIQAELQSLPSIPSLPTAGRSVLGGQRPPPAPNYRHPHHWAPFIVVG